MAKRSRQEKKHGAKAQSAAQSNAQEAKAISDNVSKPGFDKAQRKEVQKAIEAGIAQYKRQFNNKQRNYDKQAKKAIKALDEIESNEPEIQQDTQAHYSMLTPWVLLLLSWLGFGVYLFKSV